MKKILCITLALLLSFNNVYIAYADTHTGSSGEEHGGSEGSFDVPPTNYKPMSAEQQRIFDILAAMLAPGAVLVKNLATDIYESFKTDVMDKNEDAIKDAMLEDGAISKDDNYIYINQSFIDNINQKLQDNVHALDGYYLYEPSYSYTYSDFQSAFYSLDNRYNSSDIQSFKTYMKDYTHCIISLPVTCGREYVRFFNDSDYYYIARGQFIKYRSNSNFSTVYFNYGISSINTKYGTLSMSDAIVTNPEKWRICGSPFKIFYSELDVENYLNKGRTYAPKLPSGGIKIPITYINNNVDLPDLNINLDSLIGKAEADIQADIDLALKNYLDKLADINVNPPSNPTPTPSHGGSGGDFGDGTTPTPTPAIGDGGDDSGNGKIDMTETNNILKDILNKLTAFKETTDKNFSDFLESSKSFFDSTTKWLTSFGDSHTKFEESISKYLETNNGKLEQIIDAIDKLSQGKEDGEDYKCKYDYTQLSSFLTSLWNDSDKKFETMIDLLEENNEYQKKLVDTLDSIKSILIKQTIMDSFKDRSKETADKAKEKFPTSVPWDIAIIINAMSAEPKDPKFNLPIKVDSMNIDETIEVDLSSGEWANLAKTCRYMLSLLFVLFMVQLSRKLFFSKGDDD